MSYTLCGQRRCRLIAPLATTARPGKVFTACRVEQHGARAIIRVLLGKEVSKASIAKILAVSRSAL